jgi:hypothetical protein
VRALQAGVPHRRRLSVPILVQAQRVRLVAHAAAVAGEDGVVVREQRRRRRVAGDEDDEDVGVQQPVRDPSELLVLRVLVSLVQPLFHTKFD